VPAFVLRWAGVSTELSSSAGGEILVPNPVTGFKAVGFSYLIFKSHRLERILKQENKK